MKGRIEILTYKDPKDLQNREFYKSICQYPNLCASETLKLGLTRGQGEKSKRLHYNYICTIDSLIKELYKDWLDPANQIKQISSLTKSINRIANDNLKKSFKFNKVEILKSLRFLIEMDINPDSINPSDEIIKQFKFLYSEVIIADEWNFFESKNKLEKNSLRMCFKNILDEEKDNYKSEGKVLDIDNSKVNNSSLDKIVINGLHRFTPIILRMIDNLIDSGISIIFVINYLDEYPEVYKTWEEVYSWTGVPIEASDEELIDRYNLGKSLGELLNGNISKFNNENIEFTKYDNISSFADKVSKSYKDTIDIDIETGQLKKIGNISKMKEQFYSAKMEDINNLLKQYHPAQFGDKHFLAYPIGQFILSIYNMWDNNEKKLLIDSKGLKQCLSLGFFNNERYNCLDIYNKLEAYYLNLKLSEKYNVTELKDNITMLREQIIKFNKIERNEKKPTLLRRFSFYNIKLDELDHFNNIIDIIDNIGNEIFKDSNGDVNFYNHYKNLINVIRSNISTESMDEKEKEMLIELDNRFKKLDHIKIDGDIDNVRDSLHFYLNRVEELEANENQASWIVRNLEHLDGGVLLEGSEDKTYHLCLIGDLDMNAPIKEILPFPLTLKFFDELEYKTKKHLSIIKSYKERSNFLRYCFFYGTFFLNSKIVVSYIKNYHENKNSPYHLLKMLGVKFEEDVQNMIYSQTKASKSNNLFYRNSFKKPIKEDEVKNFLFCEYKYFLEDVLEGETFFYNEFTQKKYYETLLLDRSVKKIKDGDTNSVEYIVKTQNEIMKTKFFSLWKEAIFKDAYKKVVEFIKSKGDIRETKAFDEEYLNLRKKFIYAQLTDEEKEINNVMSNLHGIDKRKYMIYKSQISQKIMGSSPLERANSLEKCKYCGVSEICLERYRSV